MGRDRIAPGSCPANRPRIPEHLLLVIIAIMFFPPSLRDPPTKPPPPPPPEDLPGPCRRLPDSPAATDHDTRHRRDRENIPPENSRLVLMEIHSDGHASSFDFYISTTSKEKFYLVYMDAQFYF